MIECFRRRRLSEPAALLCLALVLGGGGPHAPALVGLVEGVAIIVLLRAIVDRDVTRVSATGAVSGVILIALLLLVGAAQLVPLPPSLWRLLPGREPLAKALGLLGRSGEWWPISLSPPDTRAVILSWLPPVALFATVLPLPARERIMLVRLVVGAGVASALLAMTQLAMGDGSLFPYGLPPFDRYPGLFANFNHQAVFLSCCAVWATVLWSTARRGDVMARGLPVVLLVAIFAAGVVITASRAGLVLLGLSALGIALLCLAKRRSGTAPTRPTLRTGRRRRMVTIGLGGAALIAAGLAVLGSYRSTMMLARFGTTADDARFTFWPTVISAIRLYLPVGSGLGTFDLVYEAAEPLDHVQAYIVNHAHNEYLEWLPETGVAGAALLTGFLVWSYRRIRQAVSLPWSGYAALAQGAAMSLLLLLLHSIIDYPLRTEALGCVFALSCALLVAPPEDGSGYPRRHDRT